MSINLYQIENISEIDLTVSCRKLAAEITGLLKEKKLFEDASSKKNINLRIKYPFIFGKERIYWYIQKISVTYANSPTELGNM